MASYVKTLKEDNGDITYPQTLASAVYTTGGTDVESALSGKASTASVANKIDIGDVQTTDIVANAVTTAKIADSNVTTSKINDGAVTTAKISSGAVTSDKIDFSSFSASGNIQLGSILIQWGQAQLSSSNATANFTVNLSKTYGNANYNAMLTPVFNEGGQSLWWAFVCAKSNQSFTCRSGYKAVNAAGGAGGNVVVNWVTIGVVS